MGKINELFEQDLKVVNMGLESFAEALDEQGVKVIQMDWRPYAGGNPRMAALLDRLSKLSEKGDRQ